MATQEIKKYAKVKSVYQGSFFIDEFKNISLVDLLDGCEPGFSDGYTISVVELTEEAFSSLPEFNGF